MICFCGEKPPGYCVAIVYQSDETVQSNSEIISGVLSCIPMTVTVNEQVAWFPEVSRASYAISVSPNGNVPTPAWSHSGHCNPEHVKSTEASPTLSVIVGGRQLNDP